MMPSIHPHTQAPHKRYSQYLLRSILFIFILMGPIQTWAKEVVLTTGERFTSSKVWQTNDEIKFNMHGLVVTVNKSDVATIIADDGTHQQIGTPAPQYEPSPTPVLTHQKPPPSAPPEKQPKAFLRTVPATQPKSNRRPAPKPGKIDGIGHGNMGWLMTPADISGLALIGKDPDDESIDQYWRPNEAMQLGQALLDGIVYGFWQNKLYSIMMWVDGQPGFERLRKSVFGRYGHGRKSSKVKDRYIWIGRTTDRMLEFDHKRNTGFFWMRSRKLDARIKAHNP